jgi:hypothetical protein
MRIVLIVLVLIASAAPRAFAQTDNRAILQRVADEYLIPAYAAFAEAANAQHDAWQSFCAAPDDAGLERARAAYLTAAEAWSGVEFISYGEASREFRAERINYWPERKNATQKALAQLLSGTGENGLDADSIRSGSAAAQGLPALERLLYDDEFAAGDFTSPRRCAVGKAIALNVAGLAADVSRGWSGRGFTDEIEAGLAVPRLATDLVTGLAIVRERKLEPVLGGGSPKPKAAEGWRSGRGARAIEVNLDAIRRMTELMLSTTDSDVARSLAYVGSARNIARNLSADVAVLAEDSGGRRALVQLVETVAIAQRTLKEELQAGLGIVIGFNSLDGD